MKKKILLLLGLFLLILYLINYLAESQNEKIAIDCKPNIPPIIKKDDEVIIQEGDIFHPELFVEVIYPFDNKIIFDHSFDTTMTGVQTIPFSVEYGYELLFSSFDLRIIKREKEVVTVEKIVEKIIEVPGDTSVNHGEGKDDETLIDNNDIIDDNKDIIYEEEVIRQPIEDQPYFNSRPDISIARNSDLQTLTRMLADVDTNVQVSIDYSNVNLSECGTYPVYYYTDIGEYMINVTVY